MYDLVISIVISYHSVNLCPSYCLSLSIVMKFADTKQARNLLIPNNTNKSISCIFLKSVVYCGDS